MFCLAHTFFFPLTLCHYLFCLLPHVFSALCSQCRADSGGWTCVFLIGLPIILAVSCVLLGPRGGLWFPRAVWEQRLLLSASHGICEQRRGDKLNLSLYVLKHTTTKRRSSRRGGGPADEWLFETKLLSGCHFYSRMEKDGRKPKTFVSTFRFNLKPQARPLRAERQREDGLDTTNRTLTGNKKLGVSSAPGKDLTSKGNSWRVHFV